MHRLKRRISRRQFNDWIQFHKVRPIDGDHRRDHLLALSVLYAARAVGDNEMQYEQMMVDPFESADQDAFGLDPEILKAFAASG